jgi:hypothetical protein
MDNEKMPKNAEKITCIYCDFKCSKQSNMNTHFLTLKHKNNEKRYINDNEKMPKMPEAPSFIPEKFICECGKTYKFSSGLSRHKLNCSKQHSNMIDEPTDKQLILMLIKENSEMKNLMMEVCKKMQPSNNVSNSHNNNSNNKFNLQFFLNDTCKDALNLTDFVSSLELKLSDLENVGTIGYVNGLSDIIIKNLKALEYNKRPVHCSDFKREIIYVKEENKWEKEKEEREKLTKAIKKIACKNINQISVWQKNHPGCEYSSDKNNDTYLKIVNESMGAYTEKENEEYINKIIKNVAKEVIIEKDINI